MKPAKLPMGQKTYFDAIVEIHHNRAKKHFNGIVKIHHRAKEHFDGIVKIRDRVKKYSKA